MIAEMAISTWVCEYQRYFTMTVSHVHPKASTVLRTRVPTLATQSVAGRQRPPIDAQPSALDISSECPHCGYHLTSEGASPPESALPSPSVSALGLSDRKEVKPPTSTLIKLMRMKDAMLDAAEIPIIAMWANGSLAIHNKPITQLMRQDSDIIPNDANDILSRFKVYTENFERHLRVPTCQTVS